MSFTCRKFCCSEQYGAKLERISQLDRVYQAAKRQFYWSHQQRKPNTGEKIIELGIASTEALVQIGVQEISHCARAE
jgi:hypothetical protein